MADAISTTAVLRPRSLFLSPSATSIPPLRSTRLYNGPMAVPATRPAAVRTVWQAGMIALCLALTAASALGPRQLAGVARTAIDGLAVHEAPPAEAVDLADLPAMDPLLAQVVDPRPTLVGVLEARQRRSAIQPFQYDMRAEDTLRDVAARFGVSLSALMWNNELETADQAQAGRRLTVLPVSGVLHRVQPGETAPQIAERYGTRLAELIEANALEEPHVLLPGRVVVVPGGAVPTPTAVLFPTPLPTLLTLDPAATAEPLLSPAAATATVRALHAALIGTAVAQPRDDLPRPPSATAAERAFIHSLATAARESQRLLGVPASVTLAQAILESDWGRSRLARDAKNLFGIKAHTRPGTAGVYQAGTWEVLGGANLVTRESFKAYATVADSIVDHARWFHEQPRYAAALDVRSDPRAFVQAIAAAGYATDPAYAGKLIRLMDRFDLYAYDE